ncbi:MAG: PQQ-binding-like beta-propeller repeat protein [Candidatus Marinimicrobia bacterium]|nr:PQQ-binding-like beta-propeller repeat protein [Candidatus Neomarinimicrobiota bacterium]
MKRTRTIILSIFLVLLLASCSSNTGESLTFVFLADTHIGTAIGANDLRNSVRDINEQSNIDFVILAGDATEYDFAGELDTVKAIMSKLTVPYHIIPGNHELKWSASGGEKFKKLFGDDKFNVSYKGYRFIGVNQGPLMRMGEGFIAREDINWVHSMLKKMWPKKQPVFFVTHYPINHTVTNSYEFLDIIKQYNVQAIMHGHGHRNRLANYSDVTGIMGRSNLSRGGAGGYNIVSIKADTMTWTERLPVEKKSLAPWLVLPLKDFEHTDSHESLKPDMSVNDMYPEVKVEWSYDSEYSITAAVGLIKDRVIFGNRSGKIIALSLEDGKELWTYQTNGPIFTEPAFDSTLVYVTSTDSMLYCLNYETGEKIWNYKTQAPIVAHPVVNDKKVYFGGSDGKFRAVNSKTGKLEWDFMFIPTYVETKPLVAEGKVIFGAWNTLLYALDANKGNMKWLWKGKKSGRLYSPAVVHPVYANEKVFVVAPDRVMSAININDGTTVWRSDKFKVRENISLSEDGSTVYAKTMWDIICAISTEGNEAETQWSSELNYGFEIDPSNPVEYKDQLYFTTQFGYVYSLNAENGEKNWQHRIGGNLLNTPVVKNGMIVISGMDGKVTKLVTGD